MAMTKVQPEVKQVNKYDKVLHENIEAVLPGLIKNVLGINAVHSEALPDNVQHTKERKPDVLRKVKDDKGKTFILHIEFQVKNEGKMGYRMVEYFTMLRRKYDVSVRQYVIYIGEQRMTMSDTLAVDRLVFSYDLLNISDIDYRVFLRAKNPEEILFALLGDFGKEAPERVINEITTTLDAAAIGPLELERFRSQFHILMQLRTLVTKNIDNMEPVSSFFKTENDIFYQWGEKKGLKKGREEGREEGVEEKNNAVVKNLLLMGKLTIPEIAGVAGVPQTFVRKVKKSLSTN